MATKFHQSESYFPKFSEGIPWNLVDIEFKGHKITPIYIIFSKFSDKHAPELINTEFKDHQVTLI